MNLVTCKVKHNMVLKLSFLLISFFFCLCFNFFEKPLYKLIIFEGSDWCSNCRRLDKDILNRANFQTYLQERAVILERIDFPQRKKLSSEQRKYNENIADKYNFKGIFPDLVIVEYKTENFYRIVYKNETADQLILKVEALLKRFESRNRD